MGLFDAKNFNGEVFQKYVETIPNTKRNELIRSRAIRQRPDLRQAMADQTPDGRQLHHYPAARPDLRLHPSELRRRYEPDREQD